MRRPVCYDVTRLLTRILNATPNGIDRVDCALATHLLDGDPERTFGATATGFGARLMSGGAAAEVVAGIKAFWGETRPASVDEATYARLVARLRGDTPALPAVASKRKKPRRPIPVAGIAAWLARHGPPVLKTPRNSLPPGSVYVNSSQFPLWVASSFEWLEARRDVKAAFFIHDLMPILMPEYFRAAEYERHQNRLRNFARFAAAGIVTTRTVAADLEAHLAALGRTAMPLFVAPTPIAPIFATPREIDPALDHPYFLLCSTLEPRKNHMMILAVWRALVQRMGRAAPKLVLVGTRGWHYGPILDLVDRSPALRDHVIEINGLSTPSLKRLIDNAQAVLMPSFSEGYGLPVHEALVAGAPVLASDISAFREIEAPGLTLLSPLDGEAWLEAVAVRAVQARPTDEIRTARTDWSDYFTALDTFLDAL